MTPDTLESDETPEARVAALDTGRCAAVLIRLVASILAEKSTRGIPDILHEHRLLSRFEVYDADAAWDAKFDEGMAAAARALIDH